jgi:uncharacterized membrane protein
VSKDADSPLRPAPSTRPSAPTAAALSLEERIGKRWITWLGALALFVGAAFFVELAVARGWVGRNGSVLGPRFLVASVGAFGLALLVAGARCARRGLDAPAQGLTGAGLAILYAAVYAGLDTYHLYGSGPAFVAMVGVTALGVTLAVRRDAQALAVLAVLGGVLTPVLVSSGNHAHSRDILCGYLAVLDLGVLVLAAVRRWRSLDLIAFLGTWLSFGGWFLTRYDDAQQAATLAWSGVFFTVFLAVPFAYHLRHRVPLEGGRFASALAAGLCSFGVAAQILGEGHALGAIALAVAAAYAALGAVVRARIPGDQRAALALHVLAVLFVTMAVPLHLDLRAVTVAWALQAPALLYLGWRHRYFPVRALSLVPLGLAALDLASWTWSSRAGALPLWNRDFATAALVPLAAAFAAFLHLGVAHLGDARDRALRAITTLAAVLGGTVLVHAELAAWLGANGHPVDARAIGAPLWAAVGLALVRHGLRRRAEPALAAGGLALVAAVMTSLVAYLEPSAAGVVLANTRFVAAAAAIAAVVLAARDARRAAAPAGLVAERAAIAHGAAAFVGWGVLSAEVWQHAGDAGQVALTVTWAAVAVGLIVAGFAAHARGYRLAGLALFLLTAAKACLVDLGAAAGSLDRIVSFLALGVLMIGASLIYHRLERRLAG